MRKESKLVDTGDDIQADDGVRRSSSSLAPSVVRMTLRMARAFAATTLKSPRVLLSRRRYLLLLSRPRCFTSLLSHILGSHPEICGSCELDQPYRDHRDLLRLRYMTYWLNDHRVDVRYLLDKVLFNKYPISSRILNRTDVKILFHISKPSPKHTS